MEAKELMIGDWVSYEQFINNDSQYVFSKVDLTLLEHAYIGIIKVAPIPLTEEILEANGWYEGDDKSWNHHDVVFNLKSYGTDYPFMISISGYKIGIYYVHELQHALRLCGLNELVDNFKIK